LPETGTSMQESSNWQCPACAASETVVVGPTAGGYYRRCRGCGLESLLTASDTTSEEVFQHAQRDFHGESEGFDPPYVRRISRQLAAIRLKAIRRYLPSGRLLEVGPGGGELLCAARAQGYAVEAVEHSPVLAERLRRELGVVVHRAMFEEGNLPQGGFDAVVSMHVIEHVPSPLRHLITARALVRPGGYLFVGTPNVGDWGRHLAGNRWPGYSVAHLHLFNRKNLSLLLQQSRWKVVGVHSIAHGYTWARALVALCRKPTKPRPASESTRLIRSTPYWMTVLATGALGVVSWAPRALQAALGGGFEILVAARAVE
jgi:2-polyprenyl-3-methyl-5-hydroxy-6-metoxy-1,4-benzoquinol methylase